MPVYDLYSKRKRDLTRSGQTDTYQYDEIAQPLRVQIRKIINDGLGNPSRYYAGGSHQSGMYKHIYDILCREYGVDRLVRATDPYEDLLAFIDVCGTDQFLDVVELASAMMERVVKHQDSHTRQSWGRLGDVDDLLEELNYRFRRAGVGYQYEAGSLIRVDSQFIHAESTKPAIRLLSDQEYEGPQDEFLSAHEHFRHGRFKEAITEAAKSFESMMKAICERKGWTYPKGARASDLLKVLRQNHLWPDYLDGSFDQLLATLQSGLPQVRNERAAHGQGATPQQVPEYVAAYALHLAASKIVLLADAAAAVPDVELRKMASEGV